MMGKLAVVSARVDEETLRMVDEAAKAHGRSRSDFVSRAVRQAAMSETAFLAFVKEGDEAVARGNVISHEDVMTMLDAMIEKHRSRCDE